MAGAFIAMVVSFSSAVTVDPSHLIPWFSFPIALAFLTLAGLLLSAGAYRRWLRADLD
jgi:branched-subunit amino acid ABC-type transport system permease component